MPLYYQRVKPPSAFAIACRVAVGVAVGLVTACWLASFVFAIVRLVGRSWPVPFVAVIIGSYTFPRFPRIRTDPLTVAFAAVLCLAAGVGAIWWLLHFLSRL